MSRKSNIYYVRDRIRRCTIECGGPKEASLKTDINYTFLTNKIREFGYYKNPKWYIIPSTYPDAMRGVPDWDRFRETHPDATVTFDVYRIAADGHLTVVGRYLGTGAIASDLGISLRILRREIKGRGLSNVRDIILDGYFIHCAWDPMPKDIQHIPTIIPAI